jgi:glycosyltransferase involved in cell wall biosynthesis
MIVKNEAPVIGRCLDSVRSLIDYWVIVDTGSTDGTQNIIRELLADKRGELHERPWRDFAHNRSEALTLARPHADYTLIIDADDALEIPNGFQLPKLTADSYHLDIRDTSVRYQRTQIVRNALPWCYQGVLHEFLRTEGSKSSGHLPIVMRRNHDGARRRDPQTYQNDAAILENVLLSETDPFLISRYTFYLAQSYRDCGEKEKAVEAYLRRADLGYWDQEVFCALYQAGQLKHQLGHDINEVIAIYLRASDSAPNRAEALHGASRLCRDHKRFADGYLYAHRGLKITSPGGGLFVEQWIYDYGLLDELAVNAYWAEDYEICLQTCQRLLREGKIPQNIYSRVTDNAKFAAEKMKFREHSSDALEPKTTITFRRSAEGTGGNTEKAKYAIVTPYFRESPSILRRCIDSVRNQTIQVEHFLIADGVPQGLAPQANVRHVLLDQSHSDYGGTPRAIGCLMAISEGFRGIGLLDADNWLEPDHVERCLQAAASAGLDKCDYVVAGMTLRRPDETAIEIPLEPIEAHVDTSRFFFLPGSFHMLPLWGTMPKEVSTVGDRFFYLAIKAEGLIRAVSVAETVNYTCLWETIYRILGETPPMDAKPNAGGKQIEQWKASLNPREKEIARRLMRLDII